MIQSTIPGFPRIGRNRELKKLVEAYWQGKVSPEGLEEEARNLRRAHLELQRDSGLSLIPVGDFSYYDRMLDMAVLLGWTPDRYRSRGTGSSSALDVYFAMARGTQEKPPLEMTKWFDTNYHYIVPEVAGPPAPVTEDSDRLLALYQEARELLGERARPTLIGPYTFLRLAHLVDEIPFEERLESLAHAYGELLGRLAGAGAKWIQLDEPALVLSGPLRSEPGVVSAYELMVRTARAKASEATGRSHDRGTAPEGGRGGPVGGGAAMPQILLQTYFGSVWDRRAFLARLPVDGIGLDLVRGPQNWQFLERRDAGQPAEGKGGANGEASLAAGDRIWVAGALDGRNVWRSDLGSLLARLLPVAQSAGNRLWVGTSCSLQFLPYSVARESALDPEVKPWLAFAEERLEELDLLRRGLSEGPDSIRAPLDHSARILKQRAGSSRTQNPAVRDRVRALGESSFRRPPLEERRKRQKEAFQLPLLPTTTIGSFPQTGELRQQRSRVKSGKLDKEAYGEFIRGEIERVIRMQEEIGLDVLVHGEFERSDMVDYFGEQLEGMAVTENGWVQSYGTRCVRPPILFGDIHRPGPMTVRESRLAQLMTRRPVKGMLTGPVTILNWSFPREDLPRSEVAFQLALALREETVELESAGIRMIQIDEPAFREGLPLREEDTEEYLNWAVRAFRLASSGIKPETQIHTHMCYSEFNEIISWIAALDADVISIENSRSSGELLQAFREFRYPGGIGPGVYDIHSPRVPAREEMEVLLRRTLEVLPAESIWVNPDCGLKTRTYDEVLPALTNMVQAAGRVRATLGAKLAP